MRKIITLITLFFLTTVLIAKPTQEVDIIYEGEFDLLNNADTTATGDTLSGADSAYFETPNFSYNNADSIAFILEIKYADSLDTVYDTLNIGFEIKEAYMTPERLYDADYDTWSEAIQRIAIEDTNSSGVKVTGRAFHSSPYAVASQYTFGRLRGYLWNYWTEGTRKVKFNLYIVKYRSW